MKTRLFPVVLAGALALSLSVASAWPTHDETPDWARRGHVYWTMAYITISKPVVEVMAALHQNLEHGNNFDGAEAIKFSEEQGIHNMQYICARTILWAKLFPKEPQLKDACILQSDGSHGIMYRNPARYAGCYNNPIWVEYVKKMTRTTYEQPPANWGHVQALFYDNAADTYHCWCPYCRAAFKEYSKSKVGRELEMPDKPTQATLEGRLMAKFEMDTTARFFHTIRDYAHSLNKDLLVCPNVEWERPGHEYVVSQDVADLLFCEERMHPPYAMRHFGYKLPLATTDGKACSQVIYLPTEEYGRSLLPQEFALGIAESAACDGAYIVDMNRQACFPDDINSPTIQEGKKYYDFIAANEGFYRDAQTGAPLAVVYPCNSMIWKRTVTDGAAYKVAEKLRLLGIPYEVITDYDLRADRLKGFKTVILAEAGWLPGDAEKELLKFAEAGGSVVISGECGTRDEFDNPVPPSETFSKLLAPVPLEPRQVGQGKSLTTADGLQNLDGQVVLKQLEALGALDIRVLNPNPKLFTNLLRAGDGVRTVQLINYDFAYRNTSRVADAGLMSWERRVILTEGRIARKRLVVDKPDSFASPAILVGTLFRNGGGDWKLVVSLNGEEVARFAPDQIPPTWLRVPLTGNQLKAGENVIELRCEGKTDAQHAFSLPLNVRNRAQSRSSLSTDGGKTFSDADILPDEPVRNQSGEYSIAIMDQALAAEANPVSNLELSLGTTDLKTVTLLAPGQPEQTLDVKTVNGRPVVTVPRLDVYAIIKMQ